MKKLVVILAAVALAGVAQAAELSWASTGYLWDTSTDAKATSISGGSIVLCLINDGADWTKGVTDLDTGVLVTSGMSAVIGKVKGSTNGAFGWTYSDGTVENGDVLTVLFKDTDGNYSQLLYASDSSAVTDTYTVSGLSGDDSTLTAFAFASSGNFTVPAGGASPEPTSGLLLLLGGSLLALRRKQK